MRPNTDYRSPPLIPQPSSGLPATEPVDMDDPGAVNGAIALHRAGKAVFAVPFGSVGNGTITWLDPRSDRAGPVELVASTTRSDSGLNLATAGPREQFSCVPSSS